MKLFMDTSAFIALVDRSDQFHAKADQFVKSLGTNPSLHTSNYILDETITRLRYTAGRRAALEFSKRIFKSKIHKIHYVDRLLEEEALRKFEKYHDKVLSFTDCITLVFLDQLGIDRIFAFDEDFRALGYDLVPK